MDFTPPTGARSRASGRHGPLTDHLRATPRTGARPRAAALLATLALGLLLLAGPAQADDGEEGSRKWHQALLSRSRQSLSSIEEFADVQWRRFADEMGFHEPRHLAAYRGYGNDRYVWVRGRLLANKPYGGPQDDDDWWDNLQATYQRWESHEIPNAPVTLRYGDARLDVITDGEGYYQARFDIDPGHPRNDVVHAEHRLEDGVLTGEHRIYLPSPEAEFMIITDMDDTVIHTGITDVLTAAQLTFLRNAKTRKPLTGVGGLYRSLAQGSQARPVNPIFYVSNSAWNMYDLLRDFLDLNDLPAGPVLLRDIGLGSATDDHKIETIRGLMQAHPDLPAILVGDSGQHDASIYADIAREFPDRVKAIYIRDVDPEEDSEYDGNVDAIIASAEDAGVPFLRVSDSTEIAHHATRIGLLPAAEVDDVEIDVAIDKQRDTLIGQETGDEDSANLETGL